MNDENDPSVVRVVTPELRALREPQFLIKVGSKYYATLAVLEYDPHLPHLTPEQVEGVRYVERLFNEAARHASPLEAHKAPPTAMVMLGSTNPKTGGHTSGTGGGTPPTLPPPPPG